MLLISTLAILITAIDRSILPTVLPGILDEFHLTNTEGGALISLSFIGTFVGRSCSARSATSSGAVTGAPGPGWPPSRSPASPRSPPR
jgi:MFS family permease